MSPALPVSRLGTSCGGPSSRPRGIPGVVAEPRVRLADVTDDVLTTDQISALKTTVAALMPGLRKDLEDLTRIPSVSLDAFDQAHVEASAEATAALLRAEGLDVEIVREGGRPAVIGHIDGVGVLLLDALVAAFDPILEDVSHGDELDRPVDDEN